MHRVKIGLLGACVLLSSGVLQAQSASIVGVVRDTLGTPITGAEVSVGATRTRSDSIGRYYVAFPPRDSVGITVRRMGFERVAVTVSAAYAAQNSIEIRMVPLAITLPGITVDEEDPRKRTVLEGFDFRRSRGNGIFLGPEDIERHRSQQLSHVLRAQRGMAVARSRTGRNVVRFAKWAGKPNCEPQTWIDGQYARGFEIDDLPASEVVGIELYDGPSVTPGEFIRGPNIHCGAIVIWTRVPRLQKR